MKKLLLNNYSFNFMIWEISPKERNKNNIVKIYLDKEKDLNVGDILIGEYGPESCSNYEVLEIIERRNGAVQGKDYLSVKIKWSNSLPNISEFELYVNQKFRNLYNIR